MKADSYAVKREDSIRNIPSMTPDNLARRLVLPVLLLTVLSMVGCAGSRLPVDNRPDLPDAFPHHTLAQVLQQLQATRADTLRAYTAKASLSIRTPTQNGNVTAKIEHRRIDSLYMAIIPGLGIEAVRMLVTPDSFFVHDRLNKQLSYGSLAFASTFLPAPLTGDDVLFRNLLGLIAPEDDVAWTLDTDASYYHLRDPSKRRHYIIDPTVWRVVRYEERTPEGDLVEARTFAEYDVFDGLYLPRRIILQRPLDDTNLSIYYRELTLNPPMLSFAWHVDDAVERVLIDETYGSSHD